jgi:flagellar biogenesis protein FliO
MPLPAPISPLRESRDASAAGDALAGGLGGPNLTSYVLVCAGLVVAIALLGWAFRRFLVGGLRARAAKRSLEVIDALPLGGKRSLAVVRCYERTFVLGLGEREVGLVAELFPEEALPERNAPPLRKGQDFAAELEAGDRPAKRASASRAAGILRAFRRGEGVLG